MNTLTTDKVKVSMWNNLSRLVSTTFLCSVMATSLLDITPTLAQQIRNNGGGPGLRFPGYDSRAGGVMRGPVDRRKFSPLWRPPQNRGSLWRERSRGGVREAIENDPLNPTTPMNSVQRGNPNDNKLPRCRYSRRGVTPC